MKRIRRNLKLCLALLGSVALLSLPLVGCKSTLQSGGAYAPMTTNAQGVAVATQAPDLLFYQVDSAYDLAYSAIDAAFKFESDNRVLLWSVSPQIKHTLDGIRPQAIAANREYLTARAVYLANPVPAGLGTLQGILTRISQLSQAAAAALPKGNGN